MRRMVLARSLLTESWGCSDCAWVFKATGPPEGNSIEEMKENYQKHRDQDFRIHICAKYPRQKKLERQ
jgi:hypothetical protein